MKTDRIEFGPMIEEIFTDLMPLAEKNEISLSSVGDASMIGNDSLIYRMLFNLTENAIKYNRTGGFVRVSVTNQGNNIVIRISDSGHGIPEEYRRIIFQPFFRVDKSRSRDFGGAGLGLSLVWEITKLHDGRVWVEKSSDEGTTISVSFPKTT